MNRDLAKQLKAAGFPAAVYRVGRKFYPREDDASWSDSAKRWGIVINSGHLQSRLRDITSGYYCPNLADLIAACGYHFARLYPIKDIWMAESVDAEQVTTGRTPEEAVGKLWLCLHDAQNYTNKSIVRI